LRVSALSSIAIVVLAGCASVLGDFSVGDVGVGGDGGEEASDGAAKGDTTPVPPGPDAADSGRDTASGPDTSGADTSVAMEAGEGAAADTGAEAAVDQSAPWTPAALDAAGELAFWLEASSGNVVISNGVVGVWNDLSQNKNNASNSNDGPTVISSAIHGHDALNFGASGLQLYMTDATSLQFGTDQIYIAAVAQVSNGSPYFFAKYTTMLSAGMPRYATGLMFYATTQTTSEGGSVLGPVVDDNYQSGDEVDWNGTGFEDGAFHIVAMRRTNSTTFVLSVDDQPLETGTTGLWDVSVPGQNASVGAVHFGTVVPLTSFEIAEVLAVHPSSGVVADGDVANVHAYLKQKYGL
jgi:hypothetical protein